MVQTRHSESAKKVSIEPSVNKKGSFGSKPKKTRSIKQETFDAVTVTQDKLIDNKCQVIVIKLENIESFKPQIKTDKPRGRPRKPTPIKEEKEEIEPKAKRGRPKKNKTSVRINPVAVMKRQSKNKQTKEATDSNKQVKMLLRNPLAKDNKTRAIIREKISEEKQKLVKTSNKKTKTKEGTVQKVKKLVANPIPTAKPGRKPTQPKDQTNPKRSKKLFKKLTNAKGSKSKEIFEGKRIKNPVKKQKTLQKMQKLLPNPKPKPGRRPKLPKGKENIPNCGKKLIKEDLSSTKKRKILQEYQPPAFKPAQTCTNFSNTKIKLGTKVTFTHIKQELVPEGLPRVLKILKIKRRIPKLEQASKRFKFEVGPTKTYTFPRNFTDLAEARSPQPQLEGSFTTIFNLQVLTSLEPVNLCPRAPQTAWALCPLCEVRFTSGLTIFNHYSKHMNGPGNNFKCYFCSDVFEFFYELFLHLNYVCHTEESNICPYCLVRFKNSCTMYRHILKLHKFCASLP